MANVLHRTSKQFIKSVNTVKYPPTTWIINPDLSGITERESKYWNINGDQVTDMNVTQKDAVDALESAEITTEKRGEDKAEFDERIMFRAMMHVMLDLYNAGKKVGAPDVSISQIRTRVRNKMDGLN